ncbi:MAG: hypothetical protein ACYDDF_06745 [Thermoplasmatota archaeon]
MKNKLVEEARLLSVNKNLNDVTTLLVWAHDTHDATEKARHIERAILLLQDVHHQLTVDDDAMAGADSAHPGGDGGDDFVLI